ncbi:MAG: DMT family transporter [Ginsengibacter sp.]
MSKRTSAILSLIFVMLIWGSSFSVTKMAVTSLPPVYFAFLRFGVASVILILVLAFRRKKTKSKIPLGSIILMGLTGITLYYIFFNCSLLYTSAATGALLQGFIPVLVAFLAAMMLHEKIQRSQLTGILMCLAGVALVGFLDIPIENAANPVLGNLLMIVCIFSWAFYTVLSKKVAMHDSLKVITYTTVIGTAFLFPAVLIELRGQPWPNPSVTGWAAIIYLGAFASALCYFLYNKAFEQLSAAQVGNFLNLDPIIGAAFAVIFLHEKILIWQIVGGILVLIGVWLSARPADAGK